MGNVGVRQVGLGVIEANKLRSDLPRPYFWRGHINPPAVKSPVVWRSESGPFGCVDPICA